MNDSVAVAFGFVIALCVLGIFGGWFINFIFDKLEEKKDFDTASKIFLAPDGKKYKFKFRRHGYTLETDMYFKCKKIKSSSYIRSTSPHPIDYIVKELWESFMKDREKLSLQEEIDRVRPFAVKGGK